MFKGTFTALITPFKADGSLDEKALIRHVEEQISSGIDGLVPCGTTGESATLTYEEHERVIELVIKVANGRVPVIAGTGSNSTAETVMLTRHAQDVGADAALLITPYYNKPTQKGLYEHYKKVASETEIPLILYNVPGRTSVSLSAETVGALSRVKGIVGIKEATGDMKVASDMIEQSKKGFLMLSGDDFTVLPFLSIGGHGVISVTSNVAPRDMCEMARLFFEGDIEGARALHYKLQPLSRAMFLETNPGPVKTALSVMKRCKEVFRLPLAKMNEANRARLVKALKDYSPDLIRS